MEKFMQRENVLLGLSSSPHGFSKNTSKAPLIRNSSSEDSNMDFNDVFGGPPRRFSMQEVRVRYSFGETSDHQSEEKPVFGEDTAARRRHQGDDFFDDIFRGDDQSYSSPRRSDSVFGSNPGSRVMSPTQPLPPNAEPFGTSLPAQLSLPAKLSKATDYPTFGSRNQSQSNTSRFSNQAIRQSPLSREASVEDLSSMATSHQKGNIEILKKETRNVDSNVGDNFHFSIYKWAGGSGVPMLTPLVALNSLKSKDNRKDSSIEPEFLKVKREGGDSLRSKQETKEVKKCTEDEISKQVKKEVKNSVEVKLLDESDIGEKMKKEVSWKMDSSLMSEVKPPENVTKAKESKTITTKGVHANACVNKNEEIKGDSNNASVEKSSRGKGGVKGKVREFVQIFNQEADSRIKADVSQRSQSSRWKAVEVEQKENDVSSNAEKVDEKVNLHNIDKKPDFSVKVDENLNNDEARKISPTKTPDYASSDFSTNPKKSFSSEKLRRNSKISVENPDDPFEVNFMVEELSDDHENVTESESSEDTKAIDAKIRQWSFGKKGNIRSLLSTLQYVLWDGSGWKPVPLVELIEANSVKRAYQKALLRLHPDKLQQKGAAFDHKYTAEKVFDILQEAWDHFNTLAPL